MVSSHPPSLLTHIRRALREVTTDWTHRTILVATSGGPDSMALMHALAFLGKRMGFRTIAHGVDHGLRREAAGELRNAAQLAETLGVPFDVTTLQIAAGGNLQARARDGRYGALRDAARRNKADWIATGHHADDRAETVLLRILRGTGLRGLGVLPIASGDLLRPMIRARRQDILAHVLRHSIPHAADPSNADPRFSRSRVRHELLPLMEALSPAVVDHLNALADQALEERSAPDSSLSIQAPAGAHTGGQSSENRRTFAALHRLTHCLSHKGSVELKGRLVAEFDSSQHKIVTRPSSANLWKQHATSGSHKRNSRVGAENSKSE